MPGFRHVVMFRWSDDSTPEGRDRAIRGLEAFAIDIRDLGMLRIGVDAGLAEGNFDVVVVADFPDRETYLGYAGDPRHGAMVATYLAPVTSARAAVQTDLE